MPVAVDHALRGHLVLYSYAGCSSELGLGWFANYSNIQVIPLSKLVRHISELKHILQLTFKSDQG